MAASSTLRPLSNAGFWWRGASRSTLAALLLTTTLAAPARSGSDPRVPAGRDPAGVAVALLGPGIDYRRPQVAERLARDGEGELIGWDFVDGDGTPFEPEKTCTAANCASATPSQAGGGRLLLAEARAVRLIVLRVRDGDRGALASAVSFAARSPARIVPVLAGAEGDAGPDWPLLLEASRRFSNLLFIVPAYGQPIRVPGFENVAPGNLIIVAPAMSDGTAAAAAAATQTPMADIAVVVDGPGLTEAASTRQAAEDATVRLAAIAARLSAAEPLLDAHGLKKRTLALAAPLPPPHSDRVRSGWIADPRRHFSAE